MNLKGSNGGLWEGLKEKERGNDITTNLGSLVDIYYPNYS